VAGPDEKPCGADLHCIAGKCVPVCNYVPGTKTVAYSGGTTTFVVPDCVETLNIEAFGGQGGHNQHCPEQGGKGARVKGTFKVTPGETLKVVVGGRGVDRGYNAANQAGTGGGGSFVWRDKTGELLAAAGGGVGGAICEGGGNHSNAPGMDGVTGNCGTADKTGAIAGGCDGADGSGDGAGKGWNNVKNNPAGYGQGGFGGGGNVGNDHSGGGGGGYGGGGCRPYGPPAPGGGGGASFNGGSNQSNSNGARTGHGEIVFTW